MRLLALALVAVAAFAADSAPPPSQTQIDGIIAAFAAKEAEFAKARENYTYRQTVKVEEVNDDGRPTGKMEEVSDILFNPEGKRTEHVVYAPVNTLQQLTLTPEDMQDLRSVQPFVLTTNELPDYDIRYLGTQQLDEIPCYEFTVKPRKLLPGKRYFEGQVWVDRKDLQIVKSYGKGLGRLKKSEDQQFPKFETYREQIDGKYWFPTYTYADDNLQFVNSPPVHMKLIVKYADYKQFKSDVNIKFGGQADEPAPPKKP